MTFDQVVVFHKIVELGSFKAAAAELHKSQPALSLSIKKLEEEMNVDLFDRSGYRPKLTQHGKAFLEKSLRLMTEMNDLQELSQSFKNHEEPEISLTIDGISPLPNFLHLFKKFSVKFPHTKLNLNLNILSEAERRVLDGEAQIGLTHFISDRNSLEIIPLTTVKMIPVMSKELYKDKKIKIQSDLLALDQIIIGDKNGARGASFGVLEGGKKWRISDGQFKQEIILAGLGWGHLAEHTIENELKEKKLVVLNFEDVHAKDLAINLIRLKKHQFGLVAKSLWNELLLLRDVDKK